MKFKIKLFILFTIISINVNSQNANSVWCFGDSAGIDFSSGTPITFASGMDSRGSCVSIADSNGSLLFYAFSTIGAFSSYVFNNTHQMMQNGDLIIGESWYNELVITPVPDSVHQYYLFSAGGDAAPNKGFYYSTIDMNQNGGLGAVTQKNIQLNIYRNADCVQAIKHGNGRDWWVLSKFYDPNLSTMHNRFYIYLVTPNGIIDTSIQDLGNATDVYFQKIIFNSNGTKFMLINERGFMCEYEFDRCSGIISNPNIIYSEQTTYFNRFFWEGAYSPNDKFFYASAVEYPPITDSNYVFQYDLTASNIPQSVDTLDINIWPPTGGGALRLAPDGKIYYSNWYVSSTALSYPYADTMYNYINMNIGVINYPDSLGNTCDFQPFSYNLGGKRTYLGLPNNPHYGLGPLAASPCDTLGLGIAQEDIKNDAEFFVFYHDGWQKLFLNAKNIHGKNCLLQIFDINGRKIFQSSKNSQPPYFTEDVNCNTFAKGIYVVSLRTEKEKLVKKFFID